MENIDTNNLSKEIDKNSISTLPTNNSSPYMTTEALFDSRQYGEDFLNMADPAALLNVAINLIWINMDLKFLLI